MSKPSSSSKDKKPIKTTRYIDDKYIIETIYHNKVPKFAVVNGIGPEIKGFVKPTEELWLQPYQDPFGNLEKKAVLLPTGIEDYGSTENLLQDIKTFISSYAYLPPFWLDLATYYTLLSWVYDRFGSIGYLEFLGDKDSGKTRIGKTIVECCYNTVKMSGAGSVPALFRLIERYRGTLFIDEADYKNTEFDSEIAKVINSGYTMDGVVWRCDNFEKDYEPRAYSVFGPKILAHREKYKDDATGSRCMSLIVTKYSTLPDHIPPQLPSEFSSNGEKIRNKALKWRLDNIKTFKVDLSVGKDLPGRYREIALPLINIMNLVGHIEYRDQFVEFMKASSTEAKSSSELSIVVGLIRRMMKSNPKHITISDLTNEVNEAYKDMGEVIEVKSRAIGHSVKLLGINTKRFNDGYRIMLTPENKGTLEKVFHDYPPIEG